MTDQNVNMSKIADGLDNHLMLKATPFERFIAARKTDIARLREQFTDWVPKFLADPCHELEWSSSLFNDAARLKITEMVVGLLEEFGEAKLDEIIINVQSDVIRGACSGTSRSTSPTSNAADQSKLSALAEILERLRTLQMWMVQEKFDALFVLPNWRGSSIRNSAFFLTVEEIDTFQVHRKSPQSKLWVLEHNGIPKSGTYNDVDAAMKAANNMARANAWERHNAKN